MQIGELANGFSEDFRNSAQFPFKEIRGMRNVLAHNYIKADTKIIWNTSKKDIPDLLRKDIYLTASARSIVCSSMPDFIISSRLFPSRSIEMALIKSFCPSSLPSLTPFK